MYKCCRSSHVGNQEWRTIELGCVWLAELSICQQQTHLNPEQHRLMNQPKFNPWATLTVPPSSAKVDFKINSAKWKISVTSFYKIQYCLGIYLDSQRCSSRQWGILHLLCRMVLLDLPIKRNLHAWRTFFHPPVHLLSLCPPINYLPMCSL